MNKYQKIRDLSLILPLLGLLLFSPFILKIAATKQLLWGLPTLPFFIFIVWLGLIAVSYVLTRKMQKNQPQENMEFTEKDGWKDEQDD